VVVPYGVLMMLMFTLSTPKLPYTVVLFWAKSEAARKSSRNVRVGFFFISGGILQVKLVEILQKSFRFYRLYDGNQ
jgi:hypothetical protein